MAVFAFPSSNECYGKISTFVGMVFFAKFQRPLKLPRIPKNRTR